MLVKGEFYNGHPLDKRTAFLDIAHNRLFEGLIILSHWPISYSEVSDLVKENFPFVIVNQKVDGEGVSYIDIDHYGGTKEAIIYLIKRDTGALPIYAVRWIISMLKNVIEPMSIPFLNMTFP